jgi:hypothetical protein
MQYLLEVEPDAEELTKTLLTRLTVPPPILKASFEALAFKAMLHCCMLN